MKMKIDLSKFKVKHRDEKTATLVHPEGHEFKVAINALHPLNRGNIDKLEKCDGGEMMAEGGKVDKGPAIDPKKAKQIQDSANQSGWQPKAWASNLKSGLGMADGGEASNKNDSLDQILSDTDAPAADSLVPESSDGEQSVPVPAPPGFDPQALSQKENAIASGMKAIGNFFTPPSAEMGQQSGQQNAPGAPLGDAGQNVSPEAPLGAGIQQEIKGQKEQQQAIQDESKAQVDAYTAQAQAQQTMQESYAGAEKELQSKIEGLNKDIQEGHIDPNHLWDSKSTVGKVSTAIGIMLSGIGAGLTHSDNLAVKYLNDQIDNDIKSQQANLGKKENLLSAYHKEFGNLKDAQVMAKIALTDQTVNKIKQAAASSNSAQAKAAADIAIGKLIQQNAPDAKALAGRLALANIQKQSGMSQQDPAALVPSLVPKEHQETVFKEIERAQNTKKVSGDILKTFDEITKQYNGMRGLGKLGAALYEPAEVSGLMATLGTTVGDLEGSVREATMNNVKTAFKPKVTDTSDRLAARRKELQEYLATKSAAPRAKAYGIDLAKFDSTNTSPEAANEAKLTPQQQSFAQWARANPNNPKAALVLKKLGIQ